MSEFPTQRLALFAGFLELHKIGEAYEDGARDIRQAIKAHEELSERCVMDRTRDSITIAELRAAMQETLDNWTALVAKIRRGEL